MLPPIKTLYASILCLLKTALLGLFTDLLSLGPRLGLGAMRLCLQEDVGDGAVRERGEFDGFVVSDVSAVGVLDAE